MEENTIDKVSILKREIGKALDQGHCESFETQTIFYNEDLDAKWPTFKITIERVQRTTFLDCLGRTWKLQE